MLNLTKFLSIVEPFQALTLLAGLLIRWTAAGLAIMMLVAIYYSQFVFGIGFTRPTGAGWDFTLSVLSACITLLTFGPGYWSLAKNSR